MRTAGQVGWLKYLSIYWRVDQIYMTCDLWTLMWSEERRESGGKKQPNINEFHVAAGLGVKLAAWA